MELLERYLAAVEAELSTHNKQEITRELRANLLDEVDAIKASNNNQINEKEITDLLKKQGLPADVAYRYEPRHPLVSGADMPFYKTILWHGSALIFVIALVQSAGNLITADSLNPIRFLFQALASFLDNIGIALIATTLAFYYLGKEGYIQKWRYQNWSPQQLPKNPSAKLKLSDAITDLSTSAFLLLLLWTPIWMSDDAQQNLLFGLSADKEYWRYVLSGVSIFSLGFGLYRLSMQSWTKTTLKIYIVDHSLFAAAFFIMAYQFNVVEFLPSQTGNLEHLEKWQLANEYFDKTFNWTLAIVGIVAASLAGYYIWLLNKLR